MCLSAAVYSQLIYAALVAGAVSVVSFLALALLTPGYNSSVRRVVVADVVALVCLVVVAIAQSSAW